MNLRNYKSDIPYYEAHERLNKIQRLIFLLYKIFDSKIRKNITPERFDYTSKNFDKINELQNRAIYFTNSPGIKEYLTSLGSQITTYLLRNSKNKSLLLEIVDQILVMEMFPTKIGIWQIWINRETKDLKYQRIILYQLILINDDENNYYLEEPMSLGLTFEKLKNSELLSLIEESDYIWTANHKISIGIPLNTLKISGNQVEGLNVDDDVFLLLFGNEEALKNLILFRKSFDFEFELLREIGLPDTSERLEDLYGEGNIDIYAYVEKIEPRDIIESSLDSSEVVVPPVNIIEEEEY